MYNVSSQPLFSVGAGNLPETCGAMLSERVSFRQVINYFARRVGEPMSTERKRIPTIHIAYYFR